jgi:hypothetical protein
MKQITVVVLMLGMAFTAPLLAKEKNAAVDLSGMNRIFLGWIDMSPDEYRKHGYSTKEAYLNVINRANLEFQENVRSKLSGKTITAAKDRDDVNTAGSDLYIKFSDALFTHGYRLMVAVHIIDLKTNKEVGTIPLRKYTGRLCGLESCMHKELEQVADGIKSQLGGK